MRGGGCWRARRWRRARAPVTMPRWRSAGRTCGTPALGTAPSPQQVSGCFHLQHAELQRDLHSAGVPSEVCEHAACDSGRLHTANKMLQASDHAKRPKPPATGDVKLQAPAHPVLDEQQGSGSSGLHLAPAADRLGSAANPPAVPDEAPCNVPGRQSVDGSVRGTEPSRGETGGPGAATAATPVELAGGRRAPATEAPSGAAQPAEPRADSGASLALPSPWRRRRKPFRTASLASQPSADEALAHQHSGGLLTPSGMAGDLRCAVLCGARTTS